MDLKKEILVLCQTLNLTEKELGNEIGVSFETINNWKNNRKDIDPTNLENFYSYAYSKGIKFNLIFEQLLVEEYTEADKIVLFHGAKKPFSLPINIKENSKERNDFGVGFYLGSSFEQAANYISYLDINDVYAFALNTKNLKITKFDVNNEWMLEIAYYRGWIDEYKNKSLLKKIIRKIENSDVIVAPIADNRMFDIINEFVENTITDEQCKHALAATNLGFQYVLKTDKAVEQTELLRKMYVCKKEKDNCTMQRISLTNNGLQKVRMARIEYKNKGKYIEELFK
ncbi:MAG: DUF3990 domain-containing protein [Bacilli bacterium]|nr:DUF3990 domain-containing protein [Bacilli bacterium]